MSMRRYWHRWRRRKKPIVVHTTLDIKGERIAEYVTEYQRRRSR